MKKSIYLLLLVSQVFWAQNAFEKGNQYYQKENYQDAISTYEGIISSGKQSAEVYFNLGNCYYKLHKVAPAIFNFEKALQLNPNDSEIQTNLDFAKKMAIDDIKVIPKVGFSKIIQDFTSKLNYNSWAWLAVVFAFAFLASFLGYYFSDTTFKKRVFFTAMFALILGILFSFFAGMYERKRLANEKPAIVFADTVSLKSEPKTNSSEVILLHEGAKVYILETIANWRKVQLTDETTGWIPDEAIKELN